MEDIEILEQKINYAGFLNTIDIKPDEYLLPLYEVIVNAIQSIEDRVNPTDQGSIIIKIHRATQKLLDFDGIENYFPIIGFTVIDDGVGFTDKREVAFATPYTNFNIKKGGKGMGRYTALACFNSMEVESVFESNDEYIQRKYKFDRLNGLQKYRQTIIESKLLNKNKITVKLNAFLPQYFKHAADLRVDLKQIADGVIEHCLLFFLANKTPIIRILYEDENIAEALVLNDIYKSVIEIEKTESDVSFGNVSDKFNLNYIRNYNGVHSHSIHLCANKREVGKKQSLSNYIPSFKELYNADGKKYYLSIYVESDFLDVNNHPQRNKFTLPENSTTKTEFDSFSLDEIFTHISNSVRGSYSEHIATAEKEKSERIERYILNPKKPRLRYRHLLRVVDAFSDIPINASDETLEAKLHEKEFKLELKRNKAFEKVFKKKEYDKESFGEIVSNILKEEAAFSKDKLADLMIKRKSVIKLFQKYIQWRTDENFMLEEDLHNIIFTMGSDSADIPSDYHNLWLLDERFTFHTHTASDVKIKSNKSFESSGNKEPDVLIYDTANAYSDNIDKINSLVVFEFKKPGKEIPTETNLDNLVIKYFRDLMKSKARGNKGKLLNIDDHTPKFGYVICELNKDNIEHNTRWNDFKPTAFGSLYKIIPTLNLHIEVMTYEQMLEFAEKRHESFFKSLGIENL